uniref:ARAD1C02112p n=1 Tax=Blastobotrys adeninivorans TaxID=409370 RepID=A0A060SYL3_BLAAD
MTSVLSRIKNVREHDFSEALTQSMFQIDDLARYGLKGSITTLAYDPVQSLLAIGNTYGEVHVLGQQNVEVVFNTTGVPVSHIHFVKGIYLVLVDEKSHVTVISLDTKEILYEQNILGRVTAVESDPSLDWLFLGLENGQVVIFDVDRGVMAPYRIDNLQKSVFTKFRMSPVLELHLHPRDASSLLVCYRDCAILFSISKSEILLTLRYELPAGAPGGSADPARMNEFRYPQLISAVWHPNGHHILTVHDDGSLVFWDAMEGNLLQARSLIDTDVNVPRRNVGDKGADFSHIRKVAWLSTSNAEDTSIIVSGGDSFEGSIKGLTLLDFGPTPTIAITSYQAMGQHYANPRRHKIFPLPENVEAISFLTIPKSNPFFGGNHDPRGILAHLSSGDLLTMSLPDGNIITDPGVLPTTLGWLNPQVTCYAASLIQRNQWVGMMASVHGQGPFFTGGAPARRHLRSFQDRTALCTGHSDGTVKIWDASHGEIEDARVLQVSMAYTLRKNSGIPVDNISFAGPIGELSVSVASGEVVLFRFGARKRAGANLAADLAGMNLSGDNAVSMVDVSDRAPPTLKEGFLPQVLLTAPPEWGRVTALKNSHIGFVAIAYQSGHLVVVDKRGPAVIFASPVRNEAAGGSWRKSRVIPTGNEAVTCLEFGIYALEDDDYSSIVLTAGTSVGNIYTFKILPRPQGGYEVQPFGAPFLVAPDTPLLAVIPINAGNGTLAVAQPEVLGKLAQGILVPGILIAVSRTDIRVIRQPDHKVAHRRLQNFACATAGVAYLREEDSMALVCVSENSELSILTVPGLREITKKPLPYSIQPQFAKDSLVLRTGDIILRPETTFGALVRIWGKGVKFEDIPQDALYDVMKEMPPRPTISTLQWVKGRQYTTVEDLDELIGGPRRPKSKAQVEQDNARKEQERLLRSKRTNTSSSQGSSSSYYNTREGGEQQGGRFGGIQNAFDNLEKSSAEYMNGLNEMIDSAKTSAFKASFKAKFFG